MRNAYQEETDSMKFPLLLFGLLLKLRSLAKKHSLNRDPPGISNLPESRHFYFGLTSRNAA